MINVASDNDDDDEACAAIEKFFPLHPTTKREGKKWRIKKEPLFSFFQYFGMV